MDSTPLDVMAVMDDGGIGRAELVLAIDIATRTICAGVLRPVGAKAVDAALLLARVTVPELMRPGWDAALAMSASRIPHQRLISLDTRMALAAAKPVIVPDTVVIDHGKLFLSEVFLRAANTLGISVQPAHQQTPTDKAIVERTFESINTLFCQHTLPEEIPAFRPSRAWGLHDYCDPMRCPAARAAHDQGLLALFPQALPQAPRLARRQDRPHQHPRDHHRPPPLRPTPRRHRRQPVGLRTATPRHPDHHGLGAPQLSPRSPST